MKAPYESAIESVTGLISEFIEDPDKAREFRFKLDQTLLQTTTTPKVDAFVKILIATRDIIIPMLRPLGAAAMTAAGIYMHYKQIPIDGAMHALLDGSFPAWGTSRHINKQTEQRERTQRASLGDWDVDD